MTHVVQHPNPPFLSGSGHFEVHQLPAAEDNLVWLLVCLRSGACAVIDGPDAEGVLRYTEQRGFTIRTILNTHTHGDHVGLNRDLERRGLLQELEVIGPEEAREQVPGITRGVKGGDTVRVGELEGRVITANGHIHGHVCFLFEDVLFSGDALFAGGCGRVFTGDYLAMFQGLARLRGLPENTRVCCAHEYTEDNLRFALSVEPDNRELQLRASTVQRIRGFGGCTVPSTLADELATNPMLRWDAPGLISQLRAQVPDADLSSPQKVFAATRKLKDSGAYKRASSARIA